MEQASPSSTKPALTLAKAHDNARAESAELAGCFGDIMTAQLADLILIDGVQHKLFSNPLEAYRERYRRDMVFYPDDSPNTGCWRGYVAEWEIDEGKLFLLKVNGYVSYKGRDPSLVLNKDPRWDGIHPELFQDKVPATLSELFGPVSGRVPATWYSGELRVTLERTIEYFHPGYGSRFHRRLLVPVIKGVCGEQKYVSGKEYHGDLDDELPF